MRLLWPPWPPLKPLLQKASIISPIQDAYTWPSNSLLRSSSYCSCLAGSSHPRSDRPSDAVCLLSVHLSTPSISFDPVSVLPHLSHQVSSSLFPPWIIDSGSTSHMTYDRTAFSSYTAMSSVVNMSTDAKPPISGIGSVPIQLRINYQVHKVTLNNVLHIPSFRYQLISVTKIRHL